MASPAPQVTTQSTGQSATRQEQLTILPPSHWAQAQAQAEADEQDTADADSTYANTLESTDSITSSIREYRTINGRTYHSQIGNAEYWQHNDDKANEVIDIFHHVLYLLLDNKLYLAPLKKDEIKKVVDIGTGTGIWAIDFADEFPNAEIIGTDVSPIQPQWVPPNLHFQIDDCSLPWTFAPDSLDYVHIRFLGGSIADWAELFRQAYICLKPGGYLESMEPSCLITSDDGTVDAKSAMNQWGKIFEHGGLQSGRSWTVVRDNIQEKAMRDAQFTEIETTSWKIPVSGWAKDPKQKEIGQYFHACMEEDMEGPLDYAATILGDWTREEIMVYAAQMRRELRQHKVHGYFWQKAVIGRKPLKQ